MNRLYNLFLWLTWRIRQPLTQRDFRFKRIYSPYELTKLKDWSGSLWWGDRHLDGIQIYTTPKGLPFLRCRVKSPPYGGYWYESDNIHSKFTVTLPFRAEIDCQYIGDKHRHSWDAPLWMYADDPNEIDVAEVWGNKFAPNVHYGKNKADKKMTNRLRFKLPDTYLHKFTVDANTRRIKFYCNGILVYVTKTPKEFINKEFRVISGVGTDKVTPVEDRNTLKIHNIKIG